MIKRRNGEVGAVFVFGVALGFWLAVYVMAEPLENGGKAVALQEMRQSAVKAGLASYQHLDPLSTEVSFVWNGCNSEAPPEGLK